jgi:hypothetical protein
MTVPDWQRLASALVANLEANGDLSESAWRAAFSAIPRHLFVPCFIEQVNGAERVVDGADPAQRDHWLDQVYADTNLVTQIKPSDADGRGGRRPTSSSSTVQGRCQSYDAAFMPLRRNLNYPLRQGVSSPLVMDRRNPQRGTTRTDPRLIVNSRVLRFLVELQLAGTHFDLFVGGDEVVITATDGSWAATTLAADGDGAYTVTQAGPRRLWDYVEAAVTTWRQAGKPGIAAFGVTASTDRNDQCVWLGDPRSPYSWPLPL